MTRLPAALYLAGGLLMAQQQRLPDCMITPDEPLCQALSRYANQPAALRGETGLPRVPVIRDQAAPAPAEEAPKRPEAPPPPAPPEPASEFQQFVEQSTGRLLPVFGRELFQQVPTTFAPADRIPVTPEYTLGPGDQLLVRGWGQIDLDVSPVVDRGGAVYIPQVGELNVAGLHFAQVQDYLKTAISRVYRNFDLSVSMGQLRSIQIFVMGHARRPGAYTVSSLSTLVNAIFVSGGPDAQGSMRGIRLTRRNGPALEFDLYDLMLAGDKSKDVRLLPGDVLYIPPVGPQVAIAGSVNTPAIYELRPGATLGEGLEVAGGLTPVAERSRAFIERIGNSGRQVLEISLDHPNAASTPLRSGDIVQIPAIVPRFENTVTLRGNVADPVRLPWRPGMTIRDLIPDRQALLTRNYWKDRNQLLPAAEKREAEEQIVPASTVAPGAIGQNEVRAPGRRVERTPQQVNWSYAVIERLDPNDLRTSLVPFHLGKAVLDRDDSQNLPLRPGDVVTVFSTSDLKVPQNQQTRYVRLEGEFASAGVYSVEPGETLRDLVKRAGGLTPEAYLFGSEFLRESSRLEQQQRLDDLVNSLERQATSAGANLRGSVLSPEEAASAAHQIEGQRELIRKMRQTRATGRIVLNLDARPGGLDALPELPLEDGDVFTVPSRPSFVNVVGAVYNSTSFLYRTDKRLGDYLRESGGPTRSADSHHAFLIRADGSVVSKSWASGRFTSGFDGLRLNPGDTIVVPEQINRTTFLKGLKDWSQIFAQFGLGAAAINVLR